MSKSRANVLLNFQCPGICLTPSQVDILVSDDSLAFCPTMYNSFYFGRDQSQIRIKSEVGTVKHVEALQFFFLLAQISLIVVLNVKNLAFTLYSVCVRAYVVVGGGGGSRRYNHSNIYHDPAIGYSITCVDRPRCWRGGGAVVTNAFYSHNTCWYIRVLYNNGNEYRR